MYLPVGLVLFLLSCFSDPESLLCCYRYHQYLGKVQRAELTINTRRCLHNIVGCQECVRERVANLYAGVCLTLLKITIELTPKIHRQV